jgi:hypothetical protein
MSGTCTSAAVLTLEIQDKRDPYAKLVRVLVLQPA